MPGFLKKCGFECVDHDGPCSASYGEEFFDQYDGPFTFPVWAFRDRSDVDPATGQGPKFFRNERISGTNRTKTSPNAFFPGVVSCEMGASGPFGTIIIGVHELNFGGEYQLDLSGNPSGVLQCIADLEGRAPGPIDYPDGTRREVHANSTDELLALLSAMGIPFIAERYEEEFYNDQYIRRWISWTDPAGWFTARGCYINWCVNYDVKTSYSLKMTAGDIGNPIVRQSRTQYIAGYDSIARRYTGTHTRYRIIKKIGDTQTKLTGDFTFLVTPDVGDPYRINVHQEWDVTPGVPYELTVEYPWIVGATVYMENPSFSQFGTLGDDFENLQVNVEYTNLLGVESWNTSTFFDCPAPNTGCHDDFEGYTADVAAQVSTIMLGTGWADAGIFSGADDTNTYDDFENYPVGIVGILSYGVGWTRPGFSTPVPETTATDDFESYTVGAITTLNYYGTDTANWSDDGAITAFPDSTAEDDFESYAAGAISTLNAGSGYWTANGVIVP